ncbi:MAG: TlpA disulfide reductase family protein [Pseudomonadota bacterium]
MITAYRALPLLLAIILWAAPARAERPGVGDTLPPFTMVPLAVEEDAAELGLTANGPFTLADLPTPYVLVEIIGVYCPVCHEMSPQLTRLTKRLKRAGLDSRITLLGIAAGGTAMEVRYIRQREYAFPIAHDTGYEIHKLLDEPKTPFTMIVDRSGKVRYAHLGMIPDMDELFRQIQALEE